MTYKLFLATFILLATVTNVAAVTHFVTLNAATEDYIDFGALRGFNTNKSWALIELIKIPSSIKPGYQLSRGLAWEDKAGDFLIIISPGGISAWLHSGGWRKIDVKRNIADDKWHKICFQYRAEAKRTELWLDGKMIGSLDGVAPPDSRQNSNHFVIGGQLASPNKRQGKMYLELSSSLGHLALLQRALSPQEIGFYKGKMAPRTRGLYLSTAITATGIKDTSPPIKPVTLNGAPKFVGQAHNFCGMCKDNDGYLKRYKLVQEMVPCRRCEGKGSSICRMCKGQGKSRTGRLCRPCKGTGKKSCRACRGKGGRERRVRKEKLVPCACWKSDDTEPEPEKEPKPTPPPTKPAGPSAIELAKKAFALMKENPPQLGRAIKLYEQAVALAPRNHVILHDMGIACFKAAQQGKKDKLELADRCFRQAIALKPTYAKGYESLGAVLGTKGKYDQAIRALLQAHKLAPKNPGICKNLAYTYRQKYKATKDRRLLDDERKWRRLAAKLASGK